MFTVKVQYADGCEDIYSCETIEVVNPTLPGVEPSNYFEAGIFLDREPPTHPDENCPHFSKHIILFGGDHTVSAQARKGGRVFVMNEIGATVATYHL